MQRTFLEIGRIPTAQEWENLSEWRRENKDQAWRRGMVGIDNRVFYKYAREAVNGERWMTPEKFAIRHASDIKGNAAKRKADPEAYNAYMREYHQKNLQRRKEQEKKSSAKYRENNRDLISEKRRRDNEKNNKIKREWRENNRDKVRKQASDYRKKRPDIAAARDAVRRGLKQSLKNLSRAEQDSIRNLYHLRNILNKLHKKIMFHVDHIVPVSKGGEHRASNLRLTTADFNLRKSNSVE